MAFRPDTKAPPTVSADDMLTAALELREGCGSTRHVSASPCAMEAYGPGYEMYNLLVVVQKARPTGPAFRIQLSDPLTEVADTMVSIIPVPAHGGHARDTRTEQIRDRI